MGRDPEGVLHVDARSSVAMTPRPPITVAEAGPVRSRRVRRHRHLVAVGIVLALLAAVWAVPWGWSVVAGDDAEGRWRLRPGERVIRAGLVLDVRGEEVIGRAPCNSFRADWSKDGGPSELLSSAVLCAPPVDHEEVVYLGLLRGVTSVDADGDRLELSGPRGTLVYDRQPRPAAPRTFPVLHPAATVSGRRPRARGTATLSPGPPHPMPGRRGCRRSRAAAR